MGLVEVAIWPPAYPGNDGEVWSDSFAPTLWLPESSRSVVLELGSLGLELSALDQAIDAGIPGGLPTIHELGSMAES
jgi:hypothetical protein